jgi:hypothetical protein
MLRDIHLESEIGDKGKGVLKNVGKVERCFIGTRKENQRGVGFSFLLYLHFVDISAGVGGYPENRSYSRKACLIIPFVHRTSEMVLLRCFIGGRVPVPGLFVSGQI